MSYTFTKANFERLFENLQSKMPAYHLIDSEYSIDPEYIFNDISSELIDFYWEMIVDEFDDIQHVYFYYDYLPNQIKEEIDDILDDESSNRYIGSFDDFVSAANTFNVAVAFGLTIDENIEYIYEAIKLEGLALVKEYIEDFSEILVIELAKIKAEGGQIENE